MQDLGLDSDIEATETNIVIFTVKPEIAGLNAEEFVAILGKEDPSASDESGRPFLLWAVSKTAIRAVTHYQTSMADIDAFLARMRRVLSKQV